MRYHHGVLRTKQAASFWSKPELKKRKLTCVEYLPLVVLAVLMVGLFMLMKNIFFTTQIIH